MSTINLRPYQLDAITKINEAWAVHENILYVLPTGGGKTVIMSEIVKRHNGVSVTLAHRGELVSQISTSLSMRGIYHNIAASDADIKSIMSEHYREFGKTFFDKNAPNYVASVDTILARHKRNSLGGWVNQVTLWQQDEAHHVLRSNKWGKVLDLFPNAKGVGVTAFPERADGKGIHRSAHGLFDHMVVGPCMGDLMNEGYLTNYKVYCPGVSIDLSLLKIGGTGDYTRPSMKEASKKSQIVGDSVDHYRKICPGKKAIVFAIDVEHAQEINDAFNGFGVTSSVITAKTPASVRSELIRRFRTGDITVLVNVDLFGEGFDLPSIEAVIMARPTNSYGLFLQQLGRGLRPMQGKEFGYLIDLVGNYEKFAKMFGLPEVRKDFNILGRTGLVDKSGDIPATTCRNPECLRAYQRLTNTCPFCGFKPEPTSRDRPEAVDGDLYELDKEALAAMMNKVDIVDRSPDAVANGLERGGAAPVVVMSAKKNQRLRQEAQATLREAMALWAGKYGESQRLFYFTFGIDVLTAQTLGRSEAAELERKIRETLV